MIIDFNEKIKAFVHQLENWRRKISSGNFAMLETVSEVTEECDGAMQTLISEHLGTGVHKILPRNIESNISATKRTISKLAAGGA